MNELNYIYDEYLRRDITSKKWKSSERKSKLNTKTILIQQLKSKKFTASHSNKTVSYSIVVVVVVVLVRSFLYIFLCHTDAMAKFKTNQMYRIGDTKTRTIIEFKFRLCERAKRDNFVWKNMHMTRSNQHIFVSIVLCDRLIGGKKRKLKSTLSNCCAFLLTPFQMFNVLLCKEANTSVAT